MSRRPRVDAGYAAATTSTPRRRSPATAPLTRPRPGHADLVGMQKYGFDDARPVLERASRPRDRRPGRARRGGRALPRAGLRRPARLAHASRSAPSPCADDAPLPTPDDVEQLDADPVRALDPAASAAMVAEVDAAKKDGDTLGGVVEVLAYGLPPGLGSPRALGPPARRPARRRAHGHPGDQGGRGRRRLPHRRPPRVARRTTRWSAAPTASSAAAPGAPAAPRAACPPARCCGCAPR